MTRRPGSLVARLVTLAAVMLTVALGLTGFSLDRGFRDTAKAALRDRLEAHLYGLMGLVDITADGTVALPVNLAEPRLMTPESDLYAAVWDAEGRPLWQSPSALGRDLPPPGAADRPGAVTFGFDPRREVYRTTLAVRWELAPGTHRRLTFTVAEAARRFEGDLAAFRRSLWGWLAASALVLMAAHAALLRLGLKPLLRLARDVKAIESGRMARFPTDYPREIRPLTENMNALLDHDRARLTRYRDTLAELAHSLKTPLSILHGLRDDLGGPPDLRRQMDDQLQRMREAVDYHLQRAATAGRRPLPGTVAVAPLVEELRRSMDKVHVEKRVQSTLHVPEGLGFHGDRGDLVEMLGNLMDNAWKWCRQRVRVTVRATAGGLVAVVEDDGPGVPEPQLARLGERGFRPHQAPPGHGIGLALVRDLAAEYGGPPVFDRSDLGGLRVSLHLGP